MKNYMENADIKSIDDYPEHYVADGIYTNMNQVSKSVDYYLKGYMVVGKIK